MTSYPAAGGSGGGGGGQTVTAVPSVGCPIPNTPDVINSIMSLMNPFERHNYSGDGSPASEDSSGSTTTMTCSTLSPLPRMQNICPSLLIKEELKLAIHSRSKLRNCTATGVGNSPLAAVAHTGQGVAIVAATASAGSAASSPGGGQAKKRRTDEESHGDDDDDEYDDGEVSSHGEGLTAEDEERRRRRRERNKIAATKCRLKKREKTSNLMQESNVLESKNFNLKTQIQELETQRNKLMKMLKAHPCAKRVPLQQQNQHQHQEQHHQLQQQHQQQLHQHQQQQQHHHQHHHREQQYAAELPYTNDPYAGGQHHQVAAEPPILKDAMFNGGGYVATAAVTDQPASSYHHPPATTAAASVAASHYPVIGAGGGGGGYASCVDDLYGYSKDLIVAGGGPSDLSHQYYNQSIC